MNAHGGVDHTEFTQPDHEYENSPPKQYILYKSKVTKNQKNGLMVTVKSATERHLQT